MTSQFFFQCPQCARTETLTLEEFRQVGLPVCPEHHVTMVSSQDEKELTVTQAVAQIFSGVYRLAAVAMTQITPRGTQDAPTQQD